MIAQEGGAHLNSWLLTNNEVCAIYEILYDAQWRDEMGAWSEILLEDLKDAFAEIINQYIEDEKEWEE